ncbi:TPA: hypothetical protein ACGXGV_001548 [Bacillus paranthracis]|uniref:hypothetical protein n=1 Tax=Bacillus sp. ME5 TaxID=2744251 RepID=UPI0015F699CE|nr:hypothetical protein [Bacillus sp. ME5]
MRNFLVIYNQTYWDALTKEFKELNLEELINKIEMVAIHGAENGWTVPPHTNPGEFEPLIEGKNKDDMDKAFEEYYSDVHNFQAMKQTLLDNVFEGKWQELLEDCFDNYERGQFRITIPCLFSILEGTVFDIVQDQNWKNALKKELENIQEGSVKKPLFFSVNTFIVKAFSRGYFEIENYKPSIINRNWVLHGRDNISEWQRVDSLRLFNALYSLTLLNFYTKIKNN